MSLSAASFPDFSFEAGLPGLLERAARHFPERGIAVFDGRGRSTSGAPTASCWRRPGRPPANGRRSESSPATACWSPCRALGPGSRPGSARPCAAPCRWRSRRARRWAPAWPICRRSTPCSSGWAPATCWPATPSAAKPRPPASPRAAEAAAILRRAGGPRAGCLQRAAGRAARDRLPPADQRLDRAAAGGRDPPLRRAAQRLGQRPGDRRAARPAHPRSMPTPWSPGCRSITTWG